MKNTFVSTFSSQSTEDVGKLIQKDIFDIEIELMIEKFIIYKTSTDFKKLSLINYLNNTFVLIKKFDDLTGTYFKPMFQWAGRNTFEQVKEVSKQMGFKSLRVILYDKNKIVSGHRRAIKALERQISNEINLKVDRVKPDTEVWVVHTAEGYGFILLKITR